MKVQIIENESFIDKADFDNCEVWLLNRTSEEKLDERIVNISEITEALLPSCMKFPKLFTEIGAKYFAEDIIPDDFEYEVLTDDRENFMVRSFVCDEDCITVFEEEKKKEMGMTVINEGKPVLESIQGTIQAD